jgi:subtilisin family serine protease
MRFAASWLFVSLASMLAGCAAPGVRIDSQVLSDQVTRSPEHFIIAAVSNEPVAFMAHAGSTPRGYDIVSSYGPTQGARGVLRDLEAEYKLREVSAWPIESLHMHCAVLEVPAGADRDALLTRLSQDHRFALTQALQTFAVRADAKHGGVTPGVATPSDTYNDPYVGLQRGFAQMDVADAHPLSRGDGVKVALIDTGVDVNHPDLRGSIDTAANFVDADDLQFERDRHGTEMAGVIAAVANNREGIVGIAPGARLLVYKACWQEQAGADAARCNSFTLAKALSAAFDAHAQVINMSLAGPDDALVGDLIRVGLRRGVLIVGAATAVAEGGGVLHQPGVIEVASAEAPSSITTALLAPGTEILTLLPGGHYDFASGASIATAQVSGIVALLLSKNASLSGNSAYQLLRDTSQPASADAAKGVNACAALASLLHQGMCRGGGENAAILNDGPKVAGH